MTMMTFRKWFLVGVLAATTVAVVLVLVVRSQNLTAEAFIHDAIRRLLAGETAVGSRLRSEDWAEFYAGRSYLSSSYKLVRCDRLRFNAWECNARFSNGTELILGAASDRGKLEASSILVYIPARDVRKPGRVVYVSPGQLEFDAIEFAPQESQ